jgi:hypothetical protein
MVTTKAPGILNSKHNEIVFSRHINIHSSVMNDNKKIQKRGLKSRMLQSSLSRMFELSEIERIPGKD